MCVLHREDTHTDGFVKKKVNAYSVYFILFLLVYISLI